MKIICISDIHSHLIEIPRCDLLLIAGDICPNYYNNEIANQRDWLNDHFRRWLRNLDVSKIIGCAGNHDFIFAENKHPTDLPWTYLFNDYTHFNDLKIYATPYQPWYYDWAFNAPKYDVDESFLTKEFNKIPDDTEILITHGPPASILDTGKGSNALLKRVQQLSKLKLHVFGHLHEGYGQRVIEFSNNVVFVNAALCDLHNNIVNEPIEVEI